MDRTRFTDQKTGELVEISTQTGPDWAFIPDALPPKWELPASLWPLLNEADKMLARLDEKGLTVPNPTLLLEPLQKREALRSSSLEGTFSTAKELLLFEIEQPTSSKDDAQREVWNYDNALRFGTRNLKDPKGGLPLSRRLITEMHTLLMKGVRGQDDAGLFRQHQVHVGSGRRYIPPPHGQMLMKCINELDSFLGNHGDKHHPLVLSYLVHYQFEAIHPFPDGNGRIGRLLLALTTYEWSKLQLPWLYMSAYFERYKVEYMDNMFRVSTHGDWDRWIEFCLRGTIEQSRDAIRRCHALNTLRTEMHSKLDRQPRMGQLIDEMFMKPLFTAAEIATWGDTSLPTARRDIEDLESSGYVTYLSGERPKYYYVPLIFRAAYSETAPGGEEQPEGDIKQSADKDDVAASKPITPESDRR